VTSFVPKCIVETDESSMADEEYNTVFPALAIPLSVACLLPEQGNLQPQGTLPIRPYHRQLQWVVLLGGVAQITT